MTLAVTGLSLVVRAGEDVRRLLGPLDLVLPSAEVVAITGTSGAGKSLLLRLLAGHWSPSSGRFRLDDRAVGDPRELRRASVLVPSEIPTTLGDSVERLFRGARRGRREASDAPAHDGLGLDPEVMATPASRLDPATRWRACLAVAGGLGTRLLLVDVPAAKQDRAGKAALAAWLRERARRGRIVVVATRDEELMARAADRIVVLYDGEVQAEGPPATVIPGAVRALRSEGPR